MPELPEVETTRRGISPHLQGRRIVALEVREPRLRWPVDPALTSLLPGCRLNAVRRRAKYLLIEVIEQGTLIWHLGMSGSLRICAEAEPPMAHDHVDLCLENEQRLRFNDPRRFGFLLWTRSPPEEHPQLARLGPEPLSGAFDGAWLHRRSRGRQVAVKNFLMNPEIVVGVGNIYACEALYAAGIHPARPAGRIARPRYERLALRVQELLESAIREGGTTLRDFVNSDGRPGYFRQSLQVYGREGQSCRSCGASIRRRIIGQRSSFYCPRCQR